MIGRPVTMADFFARPVEMADFFPLSISPIRLNAPSITNGPMDFFPIWKSRADAIGSSIDAQRELVEIIILCLKLLEKANDATVMRLAVELVRRWGAQA